MLTSFTSRRPAIGGHLRRRAGSAPTSDRRSDSVLGTDPIHRLGVPRLLATTVVASLLNSLVIIVGLGGTRSLPMTCALHAAGTPNL
ncbi:ABC transporter permease [Mycobacterium sp. TY813]|uniref:ABC transporter permease n=1 Tax=Mycobacterium TaxID=1763 RepID=UPI0009E9472E